MIKKLSLLLLSFTTLLSGCSLFNSSSSVADNQETAEDSASSKEEENSSKDDLEKEEETEEKEIIHLEDLDYPYETKEISIENNSQKIYGLAYIPEDGKEKHPLIIVCHGLGGNFSSESDYCKAFASKGYAVYAVEFRGGGGVFSQGNPLEMSVFTEVSDLEHVLYEARNWDFVDLHKVILFGASQGGLVASIVASRYPDLIAACILNYPAYNIPDLVRVAYKTLDEIPDEYDFIYFSAGYPYAADVMEYDPYAEIGNYPGPVLILHGTDDVIVPAIYSKRAVTLYDNATLKTLSGTGHGFSGIYLDIALDYMYEFLVENNLTG